MKFIKVSLFFLISVLISEKSFSQFVNDTVRFVESVLSMEKKRMVLEHLQLSEAQKAAFWPVYNSYSNATQYLELESYQLLMELSKNLDHLKPSAIEKLSKRMLLNDLMLAKVRKHYFKKFRRAISPQLANEFMKLDDSIRMLVRYQVRNHAMPIAATQTLTVGH